MRYISGSSSLKPGDILDNIDDGHFLIISRFCDGPDHTHKVYEELTPEVFQTCVGRRLPPGPVTAYEVSDFLVVSVFDKSEGDCRFAFETQDGRIIHQHST